MLPDTYKIHEFKVNHLYAFFIRKFNYLLRGHLLLLSIFYCCYRASSPVSPVLIRTTSSTLVTDVLPSPIRPVFADFSIASTTCGRIESVTIISSFILGIKSTTYSAPR